MVGIYKITNILNNKCYIGQSIDIETRWLQHIYESKTLRHKYKIYLAINKYGIENFNFEVLEECPLDNKMLDDREVYWIEFYDSFNEGYNMTRGGQGEGNWKYDPDLIRKLWDEGYSFGEIIKIVGCSKGTAQKRLKGYSDYNATTSHSRGALRAIKEGKMKHLHIGDYYNFSEAQKLFFVSSNIPIHQYSLIGEYITSYNSLSEAARAVSTNKPGQETNISHAINNKGNQRIAYGYQWSKEKVDRLPPVPSHLGKLVRCIETNQLFPSTREAANWCGLKSCSPIKDYLAGRGYKSAGKHPETGEKLHWEYVE